MAAAAIAAAALLGAVAVFQVALAAGAPWGSAAWGGQHPGVLPTRLRVASGVAAVLVYPLIAVVLLRAAEVVEVGPRPAPGVLWVLTAFFGLGTLGNGVSRSPAERPWALVTLLLAGCCAVVAVGA